AEELFDVRMALEALAARLAARKAAPASTALLREVLDSARTAVGDGRLDEVADLNTAFHTAVAEAAGNAYLKLVIGPMLRRAQWIFQQTALARAPHSWAEHLSLYEAIAAGDEAEAEARAVAHVAAARRSFLAGADRP
ncbi:MAG: FCD domain-containing protein, partial [Actinomadura sp.]